MQLVDKRGVMINSIFQVSSVGEIGCYDIVLCRIGGAGEGTTQDPGLWATLWGIGGLDLVEFLHWFGSFAIPEDLRLLTDP